jgi:hypothetical protein
MLKLKISDHRNQWFINGNPVENILIYDGTGVLLSVGNGVIIDPSRPYAYAPLDGFPGVEEVTNRNKIKFDRLEHFFCKGALYINALLFSGYSTVDTESHTFDELQTATRKTISLCITPEAGGDWLKITESKWDNYQNTVQGEHADAVAAIFNKLVAGHRNDHLSQRQAQRLINALPELMKAAGQ